MRRRVYWLLLAGANREPKIFFPMLVMHCITLRMLSLSRVSSFHTDLFLPVTTLSAGKKVLAPFLLKAPWDQSYITPTKRSKIVLAKRHWIILIHETVKNPLSVLVAICTPTLNRSYFFVTLRIILNLVEGTNKVRQLAVPCHLYWQNACDLFVPAPSARVKVILIVDDSVHVSIFVPTSSDPCNTVSF